MFSLADMGKGRTRRGKVASELRRALARNVNLRADFLYGERPNIPEAIRERSHRKPEERLAKSLVQGIMAATVGTSVDQLEKLAAGLDLLPYQLLLPNLDERNPQVVRGALPGEEKAYGPALKAAVKEAAKEAVQEALATTTPPRPRKRP